MGPVFVFLLRLHSYTRMKVVAWILLLVSAAQAEADPKSKSDAKSEAYTIGQIHHGLPVHNAYATGHPRNVGVITGIDYGYGHHGYAGHYYGKREAVSDAKSEAYTIGQIHHGLPVHNAYATGHPHNVGVITGVDYGYGRVSGYGAFGNRGYSGYGHHGYGYAGVGHYFG